MRIAHPTAGRRVLPGNGIVHDGRMRLKQFSWICHPRLGVSLGLALAVSACGGGASGDWYYHWNCHGDSECLSTNPNSTATGTNDEGPEETSCTQLLTFAQHFWGSAAKDSCDQSPNGSADGSGGGTPPKTDEILAIINPVNTYWTCNGSSQFLLSLTETGSGTGTGIYQRSTSAPSLIGAFDWQEGSDEASFNVTTVGFSFAGLIEISPNFTPNPTHFSYDNGVYDCALTSGILPGIPTDLGSGFISQGGLTWMPNTTDGKQNWSAANTYCTTTTINGTTGWRLPTFVELQTFFKSGAITTAERNSGWASVSLGGGANLTWSSNSVGAGAHQAGSEFNLSGISAADSTLYQVTCVN
jgi:hypothetical protein